MTPTREHDQESQSLSLKLRAKRTEMMASELEAVALRLFDQRGFANVTVEDITAEAHISVRTFYRYFPSKEEVLQLRIVRRRRSPLGPSSQTGRRASAALASCGA